MCIRDRYSYVQDDPNFCLRWLNEGYLLQVNQNSLFKKETNKTLIPMIEHGYVSFVASDAHNEHRPVSYTHLSSIAIIAILALIASIGTPAAPGAGAVILFTILTGMGYTNDAALLAYSLILAINRPIEMLVTSLNVVGDAATSVIVARSEKMLDEKQYNAEQN